MMGCASGMTQGSSSSARKGTTVLYRNVGEELHQFDVDVDGASLTKAAAAEIAQTIRRPSEDQSSDGS